MSKNSVLIISLVSLAISVLYARLEPVTGINIVLFTLALISWIAVPFVVFSDAKERGRKHGPWGGLCFLLGWIGGLIYYFTIKE